jgi:hypothetical protein
MINTISYLINIIINLIVGIIFGFLFGKVIIKTKTFVGPHSKNIKKSTFICNKTKKCYKLIPQVKICPISESMKK